MRFFELTQADVGQRRRGNVLLDVFLPGPLGDSFAPLVAFRMF